MVCNSSVMMSKSKLAPVTSPGAGFIELATWNWEDNVLTDYDSYIKLASNYITTLPYTLFAIFCSKIISDVIEWDSANDITFSTYRMVTAVSLLSVMLLRSLFLNYGHLAKRPLSSAIENHQIQIYYQSHKNIWKRPRKILIEWQLMLRKAASRSFFVSKTNRLTRFSRENVHV